MKLKDLRGMRSQSGRLGSDTPDVLMNFGHGMRCIFSTISLKEKRSPFFLNDNGMMKCAEENLGNVAGRTGYLYIQTKS
jgi:hypothetical protein